MDRDRPLHQLNLTPRLAQDELPGAGPVGVPRKSEALIHQTLFPDASVL
jgi:hypothetical protein